MEGLKPGGKQPFKIEITEVPDKNTDGAIDLTDVEWLLRHDGNVSAPLKGSGDFRSQECIELLKQADIVCTNPPFSLFRRYKDAPLDPEKLEAEIKELMQDEDVTKKSGIYPYVLTRQEKYLNIREFTDKMKREAYERQNGLCPFCKNYFEFEEMEADHITPWREGGKTVSENCQMLCKQDNRTKSGK